jgi:hypothetical protein
MKWQHLSTLPNTRQSKVSRGEVVVPIMEECVVAIHQPEGLYAVMEH